MITPISQEEFEEIQQKGVEEHPKPIPWDILTDEQKRDFFEKINTEVKVKFASGEIIGFNPFKQCCSMPAQYHYRSYTTDKKMAFRFVHDLVSDIETNGVETNNIEYLEEAKIKANHMTLNLEL